MYALSWMLCILALACFSSMSVAEIGSDQLLDFRPEYSGMVVKYARNFHDYTNA